MGIASTIIILDPEIVVLNGEIVKLGEGFLDLLKKEIYDITPYKRKIVFSKLVDESGIYGAIINGLNSIEKSIFENDESFYSINRT